jgi:hypothetical protein
LVEDAAFTQSGEMFITDFFGSIYRIDAATGARTLAGTTGMGQGLLGVIAVDAAPVPEPASFGLLGIAAVLVGCASRRRKSQ